MKPLAETSLCPYVGLQPFHEADREFFFGRNRDQRIISANLLSSPITILYGSSGVGKSSLLMAGVIPHLHHEHPKVPVVMFREWASPDFQMTLARACIDAVWKEDTGQPKPAETMPFDEILRACVEAAHDTILIMFDQFEEYFLYHPKSSDPESFEAQFARAINREDVCAGFVIALREDSLSKLDRFRERIPNLLSNRIILKHLDEEGAAAAIRSPLEVWNRKYAADVPPVIIKDDLVNELIDQVRIGRVSVGHYAGSGVTQEEDHLVEAPFLQLVMTRLWIEEVNAGSRELRLTTLKRLGGSEDIVRKHLSDVMKRLDDPSQAACASFFDRLVTPTGSKVACSQDDLKRWSKLDDTKVLKVLEVLTDSRILRTVVQSAEKLNATSYEIYHDVLAPAVLSWQARYISEQQRLDLNRKMIFRGLGILAVFGMLFIIIYSLSQKNSAMEFAAISSSYSTLEKNSSLSKMLALQAVSLAQSKVEKALPLAETALLRALSNGHMKWSQDLKERVRAVAFSPDGRLLATASGNQLRLWDAQTGEETTFPNNKLMKHDSNVHKIVFTSDGNRLFAGDEAGNVRLWDIQTGEEISPKIMQHGAPISAMAVGPSNLLTTGSMKDNVRVIFWNLETGDSIATLPLDKQWVNDLAFNADGSRLAVGEVNRGETTVWDVGKLLNFESAAPLFTLNSWKKNNEEMPKRMLVDAVAFSANGQWLATGDRFNTANLWDAKTGTHIRTFLGHTDQILKIAFSPSEDEIRLATASADGTAKIWDTKTGRLLLTLSGHTQQINDLAFSPDGNSLVTVSQDKQVKLWNIAMHSDAVLAVAFSQDGKFLATGSGDNTIKIWNVASLELVKTLFGHEARIQRLAFSPDGKFLVSASYDTTARIWDLLKGKVVAPPLKYKDMKYGYDQIYDIAYSADGKWLATAGANSNAVVWEAATGNFKFAGLHSDQVKAVAFSQSKYLASTGKDGKIKIWEIPSGTLVTVICSPAPENRGFLDVNFSTDGEDMVMATGSREILVVPGWKRYLKVPLGNESTGQDVCKNVATPLPGSATIKEGEAGYDKWNARPIVSSAQFTADDQHIIQHIITIGTKGHNVSIWDTKSGDERKSIGVPAIINDIALGDDGNRKLIAVAGDDMNFYLFPLNTKDWVKWACDRVKLRLTDDDCQDYLGGKCPSKPCS